MAGASRMRWVVAAGEKGQGYTKDTQRKHSSEAAAPTIVLRRFLGTNAKSLTTEQFSQQHNYLQSRDKYFITH